MTAATSVAEVFPVLSPRAIAVVPKTETAVAALKRRESAIVSWLWILGFATGFAVIVDVAVALKYNTALLSNMREELTLSDQIERIIVAFSMVIGLMGIVAGVHITFNQRLHPGKRLLGFLLSVVLGAGAVFLAAAIAYPQLAAIFTKLWNGSSGLRFSFDPAAAVVAAALPIPFPLRLASSTLFLSVGFFAALAEVAWLTAYNKLGPLREEIAHYETILRRHASYESNRLAYAQKTADRETARDDEYCHAKGMTAVVNMIQDYCVAVERARPALGDPAAKDKAPYEQDNRNRDKADRFLQSAEELSADTGKLTTMVAQFFPLSPGVGHEPKGAAANSGNVSENSTPTSERSQR